jgi:endogenous inhibitor of DNA gyrase (YacG/DUF329 family)
MDKKPQIPCATCGKPTNFFSPPTGPFCCQRCQLVDLGRWLNEEYRISEPLTPEHLEEYADLSGDSLDHAEDDASH